MSGYAQARHRTGRDTSEESDLECDVRIQLRCLPEWLSVARAVAADIAVHADFDLDSVDDIKIAVDEAGSQLIRLATAETGGPAARTPDTMWCRFRLESEMLEIRITVGAQAPGKPTSLHGRFGQHVLRVVTDEVWTEPVPLDGGSTGTCIGMRKHKPVAHRSRVPAERLGDGQEGT
jgi:serine/threonine-protein kinase RsbW